MERKYDAVIAGSGIAGLGVAAILAREGGLRVLVVDRYQKPGGRLMSFNDIPDMGWQVDVGLHMTELGPCGSASFLNARVGEKVEWGPYSESVQLFHEGAFRNVSELTSLAKEERKSFVIMLQEISSLSDAEIESWDNRSLEEFLREKTDSPAIRTLIANFGMIMTTIPDPIDMAAGEFLYIARENLQKVRQVLSSSYPKGGMKALTAPLVKVIKAHGGEILSGREVDHVLIENHKAAGVAIAKKGHPYPADYRIADCEIVSAGLVVLALPIYQLPNVLDFNPDTSLLPEWWRKRILDISREVTGLVGYMIGLTRPVVEGNCFLSALKTRHAGLPFQAFPASNFDPGVAPAGKQLLHTDIVTEYSDAADKFKRQRLLDLLWKDIEDMFPGINEAVEWKIPYYVAGCDGLARKPGLVGRFKPKLTAPGITGLYFAGDTYKGRGLAMNGAALSAMLCADLILSAYKK